MMSACANWARLRCRQTAADKAVHTQAGEHRRTMPRTPSQQVTMCVHTQQTVPHPPSDSVPQAVKGPHRIHAPADNAPCAHTGRPRCAHTGDTKMQVAPNHSHKALHLIHTQADEATSPAPISGSLHTHTC